MWPVAIWTKEGEEETIFQIGRKMMRTDTHATEWHEFASGGWLKCVAVSQQDWNTALETGRWPDGRPSREVTAAEKADIIPATPASEGGNAPVDENGEPIDEFWLQIKEGLAADAAAIAELGPINSLDVANKAAAILERMSARGAQGEAKRKAEKKPHDDAAALVQAKWTPILNPASALIVETKRLIVAFTKAEEARLRRIAEEERRAEEARIRKEAADKLAAEEANRARQAEQMGMQHQARSEEEIAEEAQQIAAETVAAAPQAETKVRVGTAHGRAVSKATVWGGKITDPVAFYEAVKDYPDVQEALQKVADRLGRANAVVPGYERVQK